MPYCQKCGEEKTDKELRLFKWGFIEIRLCDKCVAGKKEELIPILGHKPTQASRVRKHKFV